MQHSEEIHEAPETAADAREEEQLSSGEEGQPTATEDTATGETGAEDVTGPEAEEETETVFVAEVESSTSVQEEVRETLKAVIEAAIYITDEPLTLDQIAKAVEQPVETVKEVLAELVSEYAQPDRGLTVRELAGGYKMGTKPEHHESIRQFVKKLQPPLKLSLPALETLAVVAYKQPITAPEIMEIRGVQGAGVLKTLLDRRLIATGGRKDVVGKPIMYKTTKEFLVQFGLSSLKELPTLKEFEELGRLALTDEMPEEAQTPYETAAPLENGGEAAEGEEREAVEAEREEASENSEGEARSDG
jgi:segregation and condensation protein B